MVAVGFGRVVGLLVVLGTDFEKGIGFGIGSGSFVDFESFDSLVVLDIAVSSFVAVRIAFVVGEFEIAVVVASDLVLIFLYFAVSFGFLGVFGLLQDGLVGRLFLEVEEGVLIFLFEVGVVVEV